MNTPPSSLPSSPLDEQGQQQQEEYSQSNINNNPILNIQSFFNLNYETSVESATVCVSSNKQYLFLGDVNGQIMCISANQCQTTTVSTLPISALTVVKDEILYVGIMDGTILLLDITCLFAKSTITTKTVFNKMGELKGHKHMIHILCSDENRLWSCDPQGLICLWDLSSQKLLTQYSSDSTLIKSGACCEGLFYALCDDGCVRMWLTKSGECVNEIEPDEGEIVCFTVIQNQLICSLSNGSIQLWDFREDCCKVIYQLSKSVRQLLWMNEFLFVLSSQELLVLHSKNWHLVSEFPLKNILILQRTSQNVFVIGKKGRNHMISFVNTETKELAKASKDTTSSLPSSTVKHPSLLDNNEEHSEHTENDKNTNNSADAQSKTTVNAPEEDPYSIEAAIDQMDEATLRQHLRQAHELLAKASKSKQKLKTEMKSMKEQLIEKSPHTWASRSSTNTATPSKAQQTSNNASSHQNSNNTNMVGLMWSSHSILLDQTLKSIVHEFSTMQRDLQSLQSVLNQPEIESIQENFESLKNYLPEPHRNWEMDEDWDSDAEEDRNLAWWRKSNAHRHVFDKNKSPISTKRIEGSRQLSPANDHHPLSFVLAPSVNIIPEEDDDYPLDSPVVKMKNPPPPHRRSSLFDTSNMTPHLDGNGQNKGERKPSWIQSLVTQIGFGTSADTLTDERTTDITEKAFIDQTPRTVSMIPDPVTIPPPPSKNAHLSQEQAGQEPQKTVRKKQSFIQKTISQTTASMTNTISKKTSLVAMPKLFASLVSSNLDSNNTHSTTTNNNTETDLGDLSISGLRTMTSSRTNSSYLNSSQPIFHGSSTLNSSRQTDSEYHRSSQDSGRKSLEQQPPTSLETWGFVPSWWKRSSPPVYKS